MVVAKFLAIIFLGILMGLMTGRLVRLLDKFIKCFKIGSFEASALIVALATSLPEILVSIVSSIRGQSDLAVGNALGSNIVNLSLIIGVTAIAGKSIFFNHKESLKDNLLSLLYTFAPFLTILDLRISRVEGALLIGLYGAYVYWLYRKQQAEQAAREPEGGKTTILVLKLLGWIGLLVLASQLIVILAADVARGFRLPELFVGLFIVAVGTSLPELAFNLKAISQRKVSMSFGNVVGSCVANATLVVGLSALIKPIALTRIQALMPGVEYFFITALLVRFIYSKHKLDTREGIILTSLFIYYTILEIVLRG